MTVEIEVGDYCFFSRWSDGGPSDPWWVGFVESIEGDCPERAYFKPKGSERAFPHARVIDAATGQMILDNYPAMEGMLEYESME